MLRRRTEWVLVAGLSCLKFWLTAARELEVIGWLTHDDAWFVGKGLSILSGNWLGPYDHMTLIKGAGYPLWIALTAVSTVPLLLAEQLLYALACVAVCAAFAPVLRSVAARGTVFCVLLFNPSTFADALATRPTREQFYSSLTLLIAAAAAGVVLRLGQRLRSVMSWLLLLALSLSWFWHTREEGVWILPLLALAGLALVRWVAAGWKERWPRAVLVLVVPLLGLAAARAGIGLMNWRHYGVFDTVEFKQHSFVRAYASLTHVRQHPPEPLVPVPREVRRRVYAVSPAFAELRPQLEGELGRMWTSVSLPERNEIGGGSFMWALRDAVSAAGHYRRGANGAKKYYDRLSAEIESARLGGRLDARPPKVTLMPPLIEGQLAEAVTAALRGLVRIPAFTGLSVNRGSSDATEEDVARYARASHSRLAPPEFYRRIHMRGWIVHVDGPLDITVETSDGRPVEGARVKRLPSPDVYEHLARRWKPFPPARNARFEIDASVQNAYFVIRFKGRPVERAPFGAEAPMSFDPNVRMSVDEYRIDSVRPVQRPVDEARIAVLDAVCHVYQWVFPIFFFAAAAAYGYASLRSRDLTMLILILAFLSAVAARAMILALIEVTSFGGLVITYQAPMYALVILSGVLMAHQAWAVMRGSRGK